MMIPKYWENLYTNWLWLAVSKAILISLYRFEDVLRVEADILSVKSSTVRFQREIG